MHVRTADVEVKVCVCVSGEDLSLCTCIKQQVVLGGGAMLQAE